MAITQAAVPAQAIPGSDRTWWLAIWRIVLLGLAVIGIVMAMWPRGSEATLDELVDDLRGGQVSELQLGEESEFGGMFIGPWQHHREDLRVRWRADDGPWQTFLTKDQQITRPSPASRVARSIGS